METENSHNSFQSSGSMYASFMKFCFMFFDFIVVYDERHLLPIFRYVGKIK